MDIANTGFSKRFTEACRDAGLELTHKALGKAFGVSSVMAGFYKKGEKLPSMAQAIRIAEKTGVCVEWLLTGRGPKHPPDATEGAKGGIDLSNLSSESEALIRALLDTLSKPVGKASNHDD